MYVQPQGWPKRVLGDHGVALGGYVNEAARPADANVLMRVIRPDRATAYSMYIACKPIAENDELLAWYGNSAWQHRASTSKKTGPLHKTPDPTRGKTPKKSRPAKQVKRQFDFSDDPDTP